MDLMESADGCNLPGSVSDIDRVLDLLGNNKISYEQPTVQSSGDLAYVTQLWVFSSSQSTATGFYPRAENFVPNPPLEPKDKIRVVLKLLSFREKHIIVQYWSPRALGRHRLLTTLDQPFGLGVLDEGLCLFRKESEKCLIIVDNDHEEDDCSPPARVFRRGLPEWTPNVTSYLSKDFPQQNHAINCNLHAYLAFPVFDSNAKSCVGVLELLMSSNSTNYAFAVQQVHTALKTQNLTTPLAFDFPTSLILSEHRQNLDKICSILKNVCDIYNLPLAQTWAVSSSSTFVSHDQIIDKSCSSFNTKCIGKVCMFTAGLPFDVRDSCKWKFREQCREQHLEKSRGVVGRALSSQGLCFCGDVTKFSEEEYPLVHYARIYKLSSCFAIFLHSLEGNADYVLEFFLPLNFKDNSHIQNVVQTLKENIEAASGFKLGDTSSIEIGPSREVSNMSLDTEAVLVQSFLTTEPVVENVANMDSANILNRCSLESNYPKNIVDILTNTERLAGENVVDAGKNGNEFKRHRKRKIESLTLEAVAQQYGKPLDEAAHNLRVSRSTIKRFCRDNGITRWPKPSNTTASVTDLKQSQESLLGKPEQTTNIIDPYTQYFIDRAFPESFHPSQMLSVTDGSDIGTGTLKKTKNNNVREVLLTLENLLADNEDGGAHFRPVPKRVTDLKLLQKSLPEQDLQQHSNVRLGMFIVVFLLVRLKRWSCVSKHHGFSGRWWICGKHRGLVTYESRFNIYQVARLIVRLKRWRNKSLIRPRGDSVLCVSTGRPEDATNIVNPSTGVSLEQIFDVDSLLSFQNIGGWHWNGDDKGNFGL